MSNLKIIEKQVLSFRQAWGLGATNPVHMKTLLSRLNLITVFRPLSSSFSGMALKIDNDNKIFRFILVNSNHVKGKQHFTIGHELYHHYIQHDFSSMICNTGLFSKTTPEEYNADLFASILLLPEDGISEMLPFNELSKDMITLKTILRIEQYYSCSRTALLYRLKQMNLLSSDTYEKYCKNVKSGAVQYGYSTELYEPANHNLVIGDYGEIARSLFDKELISETHYLSLLIDLGMNEKELETLMNGETTEHNNSD
jgi:Zn-dependent peptidase ImmA (M78 family)